MNVLESTNANGLNPDNFFRILRAFHQWALNSTLHRGPFGSRRTWIHLLTEMKWSCTTNIHIAVWQNSHKSDTNRPANSMRLTRLSELGNEFSIGLQWLGPENPFKLCDKPAYFDLNSVRSTVLTSSHFNQTICQLNLANKRREKVRQFHESFVRFDRGEDLHTSLEYQENISEMATIEIRVCEMRGWH